MLTMSEVAIPQPQDAVVRARFAGFAAARRAEQEALHDADPWARADAQADVWLRGAAFLDGTKDQYRRIYLSWRLWCVMIDVPPFDALRSDVDAFVTALAKIGNPAATSPKPLARSSIARHMAGLSSYYGRAIEDGATDRNPVPTKHRPKINRDSRQPYLSPAELRALIAAADLDGPRSSALVALLVLACLRASEALTVRIEGITYQGDGQRLVRVIRKGDKHQEVPLPPAAWARVAEVVAGRREGPIIATSTGRPVDRKAAWGLVRRLGRMAGIATPIGPHTLRHAYITRGHELGIPVADLQRAAGHSSVDTTRGYDRSHLDPSRHPSYAIADDLARPARAQHIRGLAE